MILNSTATGGATWNASASRDLGGNTGWNITAPATARYWVGGTAAWDGTAGSKWATTSGGASGASAPGAVEQVFFTNLSTGTCTISSGNSGAFSLDCTGFTGTLAGTTAISLYGSVTLVAGMTYTYTGTITFRSSATLTTGGKTLGSVTVSQGTVTLGSACTLGTTSTFLLGQGTLALSNFTLSTGIFSALGNLTRQIQFGTGNIALTSTTAGTTVLSMADATNFTWTGTGGFTRNMAATATVVFGTTAGTTSNAPNLTVNAGASTLTITSGSYFKNLIFTGSTCSVTATVNIAGNLTLASGGTYTSVVATFLASGTITSNGRTISNATINGAGITVTLADAMTVGSGSPNSTTLTAGTLDLAGFTLSTAVFLSANSNTRAISFGSGNIALTSTLSSTVILDMSPATSFTFTGTGGFTRNMGVTATVRFGSTGATTSNAPNLTVNAGAATLTVQGWFKNLIFTGSTCTVTGSPTMAGNLTLASGGTYTSLSPTFRASGTVTSTGKTISNVTVNASGDTVTLADAINSNNTLTLTQGTFDAANFNVTTVYFSSNNSNTRTLSMGTGTWTVSGGSAFTTWNTTTSTGLTINASTSTITMTNASTKTFAGGGLTYYNLNQGGAGTLTISGSNTFNNITNSTQPATVTFTAGTTQTVSAFGLSGTAGNLITINSNTPGSQFTLSDASGTINAQYLSIQDSVATGGAVWNALLTNGNVNNGNNTGWFFFPPGNMFLMFI